MTSRASRVALGLMSGTSLDGIDGAIVRTDGERILALGPASTVPYDAPFRDRLRAVLGADAKEEAIAPVARELTLRHAEAARAVIDANAASPTGLGPVEIIGFHGHTVLHRPERRLTRQIGDGVLLARATGVAVVDDFRGRDVAEGGQGAPLAPLYHAALAASLEKPLAVLNVGGVANLTFLNGDVVAFDTGPGNALIDDWTRAATGQPFDAGGGLAGSGRPDDAIVAEMMEHSYFTRPPPKSLDRGDIGLDAVSGLSPADGAATLTAFTAAAVARAVEFLPALPGRWLVSGGGRHNRTLMGALRDVLAVPVEAVEAVGWQGDALEAQAFAFLAVRSIHGLPLSLPSTTGVARPMTGGKLHGVPGAASPR
jgi:anhydro-N-acetylmuramic acid kinase